MPIENPAHLMCEQFGLDARWRNAQLTLIGLLDDQVDTIEKLHQQVLTDDARTIVVDALYDRLLADEQACSLISSFDIDYLKTKQNDYLKEFGAGFREEAYFARRIHVATVHARASVQLGQYLSAFGIMQALVVEVIETSLCSEADKMSLIRLVQDLTTLDIVIATEVYYRMRFADLNWSLQHLEQERQHLRQQLEQDALTGVSSRTALLQQLDKAVQGALKTGQPLCLIMADLDHFKQVNDTLGHLVGDQVLKEIGQRIRAALREFDLVGRFGGEEFCILLENTSPHTAGQIAERIRARIGNEPVQAAGNSVEITISQGLAIWNSRDNGKSLLQRADQAMYRAKQTGRNCVVGVEDAAGR